MTGAVLNYYFEVFNQKQIADGSKVFSAVPTLYADSRS